MKRFTGMLVITLALTLVCSLALASGSWGQINQPVGRADDWTRYEQNSPYALGESKPLDGYEGVSLMSWGNYLSVDGSTVCVPMGMEMARQLLNLPEDDLAGFVNFSTTHSAYERLIGGIANPSVTVLSQNAMLEDTAPVRLMLGTAPSKEERDMAASAGVTLVQVPVCYDAFVFLVNTKNPVQNLSHEQIVSAYSGKHQTWDELGGTPGMPLRAYQRPQNSGSQTAMEELVMKGEELVAESNYISDGMGDLVSQIGNYDNGPDALGYSYLYYVDALYRDGNIRVLSVDGVAPTAENMRSGAYPYTVCYYAVYREGDAEAAKLVDWMRSEAGQKSIAQAGYVPYDDVSK